LLRIGLCPHLQPKLYTGGSEVRTPCLDGALAVPV
jgi:hypothetical protein